MSNVKTALGDGLENYPNSPQYDQQCKIILSDKQILARIMKTCIPEYKDCTFNEIIQCIEKNPKLNVELPTYDLITGRNTEDTSIPGAMIRYDILFTAMAPNKDEEIEMFINIEAQNKDNPGYPLVERGLYYCSRLISRQKNSTDGFQNSEYGKLKKVYSIWICMNSSEKKSGTINSYSVSEKNLYGSWKENPDNYDLFNVIMIYPAKAYDLQNSLNIKEYQLMEMLRVLFTTNMDFIDKKCYLEENCDIMLTKELKEEVEHMCNLSQGVREDERVKTSAEYVTRLMTVKSLSIDEAMDLLGIADAIRPLVKKLLNQE